MFKMRRLLPGFMVLLMLVLTACGGSPAKTEPAPAAPNQPAAPAQKTVIKLGHHHNVGGLVDFYANTFAAKVKEKTNGSVEIQVFPGAQLGQEREAADGVLMGSMDATVVSSLTYDRAVPQFGLDFLPFMYADWDELLGTFNGPVGKELEQKLEAKGGRILGWIALGARDMMFTKKKVTNLAEMKDMKMRSSESDLFIGMFRALGTKPTAITWGEAYTALQTGVVEGMESPPGPTVDMKFYEVTKYFLKTHHMWGTMNLTIHDPLFKKLTKEQQDAIIAAGKEATDAANAKAKQDDVKAVEFLKSKGMEFVEVSEAERAKFRDAMGPVVDKWAKDHQAEALVKQIRDAKKK